MKKWLHDKHNIGSLCFAFVSLLLMALFVWALKNPPSEHENNPYNAYSTEKDATTQFVLPNCIDTEKKTTRQCTEREAEQYYADRSALEAQWQASDKAHWGFYVGLLGMSLLFWTLYETLAAGKELRKQTGNSEKATRAEFQPYLTFSERIKLHELKVSKNSEGAVTGAVCYVGNGCINIRPEIRITNEGKTPATNLFITHRGRIFEKRIEGKGKDRQQVIKTYIFDGSRAGTSYLGINQGKDCIVTNDLVYDHDLVVAQFEAFKSGEQLKSIRTERISLLNAFINFTIVVSFTDQFSDVRRAFMMRYVGKIDDKGIVLSGVTELNSDEGEYITNQEEFKKFAEMSKNFPNEVAIR